MSDTKAKDVHSIPLDKIDVSDPAIYCNDNWQPLFARLRAESPVHYCADSPLGPYWSVTSHDLIKQVNSNHGVFSSAQGMTIMDADESSLGDEDIIMENFLGMDPPEHDTHRASVAPSVAPSNLANFEPLIRERAADILDRLPVDTTINWVDKVSIELTSRMLATLFDFPYENRRKLVYWSDMLTNIPELTGIERDMEQTKAELMECAGVFTQLWEERAKGKPGFDLISMLAHGKNTRDMVQSPMLFLGTIMLLIIGGNDTTRSSISGGVIALNQFPEEHAKLRGNPRLISNMVSEMVRWQTPVIHMRRTAVVDTELGGKTIKAGDKVVMWYLSGNRDEGVFEDADRLIIDRPNARAHVSFGFGIHRCMGNRLAEMQLRVLWEEIVKRFDKVELVGDVVRQPNNCIRGITEVPVRLIPK